MNEPATIPKPPYYAVIFTSLRSADDSAGYQSTAERMFNLAREQPGFLGFESARGADGLGITVSYWSSLDAIQAWRNHAEHAAAQEKGRTTWYTRYSLRISRVEHAYEFEK